MTISYGIDGKVYRQTTGDRAAWPTFGAAPNLSEMTNVADLTLTCSANEADLTIRAGGGYSLSGVATINLEVSFNMLYDIDDTHLVAIEDAYHARTTVALAVLKGDKDTEGTRGVWADWAITGFEKQEQNNGAQMVAVTIKPSLKSVSTPPPQNVVVDIS